MKRISRDIIEALACPRCKKGLALQGKSLRCAACKKTYRIHGGIIELIDQKSS